MMLTSSCFNENADKEVNSSWTFKLRLKEIWFLVA